MQSTESWGQLQWEKVLEFFGNDEFNVRVWGTFWVSVIVYWGIGAFFTIIDVTGKPSFMLKYKVQDNFKSYPISRAQLIDLVKVLMQNQALVFPLAMLAFYVDKSRGYVMEREIPGIWTCIYSFVVFATIREITFYYSHRLLHHPYFYKTIHKKHHTWTAPVAIAAAYCHPLEHVVSNVLPIVLGPSLLNSHTVLLWLWTTYSTIETLTVHSGYHLPFFASPEFHDYHHLKFNYNFGVFGVLDYIHGTDSMFRKSKQFLRHKRIFTSTPIKVMIP